MQKIRITALLLIVSIFTATSLSANKVKTATPPVPVGKTVRTEAQDPDPSQGCTEKDNQPWPSCPGSHRAHIRQCGPNGELEIECK